MKKVTPLSARTQMTVCLLLAGGSVTSAFAAGPGHGFAWAAPATQERYTPSAAYAFNSSGGPITIIRRNTGVYRVTFSGLGGRGAAGGNVQVTAYGDGSEVCKVESWNSARADFIVNVRCHDVRGRPTDTRYSLNVMWPDQGAAPTPQGTNEISRRVLDDGKVEIRYSDGSGKLLYDGGYTNISPDGAQSSVLFSTHAPAAIPPSPPAGSLEQVWLEYHSEQLLNTLSRLVGFDQNSIDNYLAAEGEASVYDRIAKRRRTVDYLVTAP